MICSECEENLVPRCVKRARGLGLGLGALMGLVFFWLVHCFKGHCGEVTLEVHSVHLII